MAQKRKLEEFENDGVGPMTASDPLPNRPAHSGATLQKSSLISPIVPMDQTAVTESSQLVTANLDAEKWEVAVSKKAKKKKKKSPQREDEIALPVLKFSSPVFSPLRIKDLQSLILYLLADGVAPQWVAIQQSEKIDQIVALMVPGMDKALSEAFVQSPAPKHLAPSRSSTHLQSVGDTEELQPGFDVTPKDSGSLDVEAPSRSQSSPGLHLIPVKAPGDPKTGRIHSLLQSMLISPETKAKSKTYTKQEAFRPVLTSITGFVHSAEELVLAEYPIHPACFTESKDAELEMERREATGQSAANGWVDSNVNTSTLPIAGSPPQLNRLDQGLRVYAMDCEMVLTTDEKYSLARISVLNWLGKTVLDKHVKPALPILNYFTQFSGITPEALQGVTTSLQDIQKELLSLLTPDAVLIGHSLESDMNALKMTHPFVVDTALLYPHPRGLPLRSSLKFLANKYLKREIQNGRDGHDSVEDARAALDLVRLKCEKGPRFGVSDAYGESIFSRLARSGRKTAIIDYGNPDRGFGQHANVKIACQDDDEVMKGVQSALVQYKENQEKAAFIWGRFRNLETARGWDSNRDRYATPEAVTEPIATPGQLEQATEKTLARLQTVYESLPDSTVLIVYPGPSDMREVLRLQEMHRAYLREFKVKKWDELSVQWTDNEEQALRKAFESARQGLALVGIK